MRPPVWAVVSAVVVPVALVGGWLVAGAVQPPGYDPVRQTISVLAGRGATHRWIMTSGLYLVGLGHLVTAAGLRGARMPARIALAIGGLAGIGLASFAEPMHGSVPGHVVSTTIGVVVLAIFPVLVLDRGRRRFPMRVLDVLVAGLMSASLLIWLVLSLHSSTLGLSERVLTAQQSVWPLLVVLGLRASTSDHPHHRPHRPHRPHPC